MAANYPPLKTQLIKSPLAFARLVAVRGVLPKATLLGSLFLPTSDHEAGYCVCLDGSGGGVIEPVGQLIS